MPPPGRGGSGGGSGTERPVLVPPEPPPRSAATGRCRRPYSGPGAAASLPPSLSPPPRGGGVRGRGAAGSGSRLSQPSRSRHFQGFRLAPEGQAGASPPLLPAAAPGCASNLLGGGAAAGAEVGPLPPSAGAGAPRAGLAAPPPVPAAGGEGEAPLRPGSSRPAAPGWGPAWPSPPLGAAGHGGRAVSSETGWCWPQQGTAGLCPGRKSGQVGTNSSGPVPGTDWCGGRPTAAPIPAPVPAPGGGGRWSRGRPARNRRRCRVGGGFFGMEMSKSPFLTGSQTSAG